MREFDSQVLSCTGLLVQGLDLLARLGDELYAEAGAPHAPHGGTGTHLRHCLDAFNCFLAGVGRGRVDYGARGRDERVERVRAAAIERVRATIDALLELDADADAALLVRSEAGADAAEDVESSAGVDGGGGAEVGWCRSTVGRELEYLQSHTVHHYALIALLLRLRGFEPGAEFGVAPSTLRHWKRGALAAR